MIRLFNSFMAIFRYISGKHKQKTFAIQKINNKTAYLIEHVVLCGATGQGMNEFLYDGGYAGPHRKETKIGSEIDRSPRF